MNSKLLPLAALCALSLTGPGRANIVLEPTFEQKMAESDLVVIGTVTAVNRGSQRGLGSTATVSVLRTLKGEGRDVIVVTTYHPIDELNPRCCQLGATYVMFLRASWQQGQLAPVHGGYGLVRIGGPERHIVVLPESR